MEPGIPISLVLGWSESPAIQKMTVPVGTTVLSAILQSQLLQQYPMFRLADHVIGIYGKPCRLEVAVQPFDRIEIYAPLQCDPKTLRRQRAASSMRTKRASLK